jgi:hypothetical protein
MKALFLTLGHGTGHLMRGMALINAIRRNQLPVEMTLVGDNRVHPRITDGYPFERIPVHYNWGEEDYHELALFKRLTQPDYDILLVDHAWGLIQLFGSAIQTKKIGIFRQVNPQFFKYRMQNSIVTYAPSLFDEVFLIEPFTSPIQGTFIPPIVFRNPNEIFSREEARDRLQVPDNKQCAVIAQGGVNPQEFEQILQDYSYLEDVKDYYLLKTSTHFEHGIFPLVDYYNGIDLLICGAGYNQYWETRFFDIHPMFFPFNRLEETQAQRLKEGAPYTMRENGADVLVNLLFRYT